MHRILNNNILNLQGLEIVFPIISIHKILEAMSLK